MVVTVATAAEVVAGVYVEAAGVTAVNSVAQVVPGATAAPAVRVLVVVAVAAVIAIPSSRLPSARDRILIFVVAITIRLVLVAQAGLAEPAAYLVIWVMSGRSSKADKPAILATAVTVVPLALGHRGSSLQVMHY